jgi:hypothetical protein
MFQFFYILQSQGNSSGLPFATQTAPPSRKGDDAGQISKTLVDYAAAI